VKTGAKTLIVIAGPTAVGKTSVAIKLAKKFETEIISADSRQFFRELSIGTAKPSEKELLEVKHHFINTLSIKEEYDAAQFGRDALEIIHQLFHEQQTVILCGGSGLYIKAVTEGFDDIPEIPDEIRESLMDEFSKNGLPWLQEKMKELDPELFETIDQQNPQRLMRALEVRLGTGTSISTFRKKEKLTHDFKIVKIGLELPREELYTRIDDRMDAMIDQGLFTEAEQLYAFKNHNALQTVGYQEIFDFMDGHYDKEEAVRLLKRNSRRYAKRQLTWFKRDAEIKWFSPYDMDVIVEYINSSVGSLKD
jgi:tRNA dimethylallyltransferase